MYVVFIVDHIHHLMNESKMLIFVYNSDRRVYWFYNTRKSWNQSRIHDKDA